MFLHLSLLFLLIPFISAFYGIKNEIHATPDPRVILIVFEYDASVIFTSNANLNSQITVSLSSKATETIPTFTKTIAFIDSNNKVAKITLTIDSIPYATTITVDFPTISPTDGIYLASSRLTLSLHPYDALETEDADLLDTLTLVETISQYLWMFFATFAMLVYPYSQVYFNVKLMMETADILKTANIGFNNFLLQFWKKNNNQAAGLKFINFISIYAEGNSFNAGYTRDESYITSERAEDYKFSSIESFHRFYNFPLFFDAWGTTFFVLIIILIFIGLLELIRICVRRKHGNLNGFFVYKMRIWLRWNLLLAVFFGSSASIFYYSILQFIASTNTDNTTNNKINLGFAVSIFIIWTVGLSACLLWLIEASAVKKQFGHYYQVMNKPYKKGKKVLNFNFIFVILKYVIFSAIVMFSNFEALGQAILLVIFECFYFIYLSSFRPFSNRRCFIFQIFYEVLFLLYLVLFLVIAKLDNDNNYTSTVRDTVSFIIAYTWMAFPYIGTIFGFLEMFVFPWLETKPKELPKIEMLVDLFDKKYVGIHSRYSIPTHICSEVSIEEFIGTGFLNSGWKQRAFFERNEEQKRIQKALDLQLAKLGKKSNTAADPENASMTVSVDEIDFLPYRLPNDKSLKPPKVSYTNKGENFLKQKPREVSKIIYLNEQVLAEIPEVEGMKSYSPEKPRPMIFSESLKAKMPEVSIKPFHTINKSLLNSASPNQTQTILNDNSMAPMVKQFNYDFSSPDDGNVRDDILQSSNKKRPTFKIFERDEFKFNPELTNGQNTDLRFKDGYWPTSGRYVDYDVNSGVKIPNSNESETKKFYY